MTVRLPNLSEMAPERAAPIIIPKIPELVSQLSWYLERSQSVPMAAMTPLTMPWSMASNIHPTPTSIRMTQVVRVMGSDSMRCEMVAMGLQMGTNRPKYYTIALSPGNITYVYPYDVQICFCMHVCFLST